jgi:hypothetical protein
MSRNSPGMWNEMICREPSLRIFWRYAKPCSRDVLAGDLRNGIVDLRYRIDAENEGGGIVYTLSFKHAFSIIPEAA